MNKPIPFNPRPHDHAAETMAVHAAFARRVVAAKLIELGQPATPEALAALTDVDLHLVRVVLDGLVQDRQIVQMGRLFAWPKEAA